MKTYAQEKSRHEKILALTREELVFLIDSPEYLKETTEFFAKGGFTNYTDADLDKKYKGFIDFANEWMETGESK